MPTQSEEELIRRPHYHAYKIADGNAPFAPIFAIRDQHGRPTWQFRLPVQSSVAKSVAGSADIFNGWPAVSLIPASVDCSVRTGRDILLGCGGLTDHGQGQWKDCE